MDGRMRYCVSSSVELTSAGYSRQMSPCDKGEKGRTLRGEEALKQAQMQTLVLGFLRLCEAKRRQARFASRVRASQTNRHDRGELLVVADEGRLLGALHERDERDRLRTLDTSGNATVLTSVLRLTHLGAHGGLVEEDDRKVDHLQRALAPSARFEKSGKLRHAR